ncbi:MAG TPA: hypothetical protein VMB48_01310 [Steroidobacteraceae bacterium]|nr:hypothetical protein [Steroidobacteraceae bacterium]
MSAADRRLAVVRTFGSGIVAQALLSATNLVVGLILLRRTNDEQYGYYVLVLNAVLLLTSLQTAFVQPHLVIRLARAPPAERANLTGGLFREQRGLLWPLFAGLAVAAATTAWLGSTLVPAMAAWVAAAASLAAGAALFREYLRVVLFAYRRSASVLRADLAYAGCLILSAALATLTPAPAAYATLGMGVAAVVGGVACSRALWRFEPWNLAGAPGILRAIAHLGTVTAGSAAVHWLFSQGYNFLVVAVLDVRAVAAIAATRMLIMPINLLSTGIGTIMLPTITGWMQQHAACFVLRRLLAISAGLTLVALGYFGIVWLVRDWVFAQVMHKQISQRDPLLLLWFAVGILMLFRDQLLGLLLARERFHVLAMLTLASAVVALVISLWGMRAIGVTGALLGVLCGEVVNVSGLLTLAIMEAARHSRPLAAAQEP